MNIKNEQGLVTRIFLPAKIYPANSTGERGGGIFSLYGERLRGLMGGEYCLKGGGFWSETNTELSSVSKYFLITDILRMTSLIIFSHTQP